MKDTPKTRMKLPANAAAEVLSAFIREDRTAARIYRERAQKFCYTLTVASFAISAFLIGNGSRTSGVQLRSVVIIVDLGLVSAMALLFWRNMRDLYFLRRAMKARQNMLNTLDSSVITPINVFPGLDEQPEPDIKDTDLWWVLFISVGIVLCKTLLLCFVPALFVAGKGTS